MRRKTAVLTTTALGLLGIASPGTALADDGGGLTGTPGAPGIGDPYYPLDGNGGYDVQHYDLALRYDPATDVLTGVATISSRALQDLSGFDLDLVGLEVRSVTVHGQEAAWTRDGQELTIVPARPIAATHDFTTVVSYSGVPETIVDETGPSGFIHTDDGALVAGQPHGAATWFPANDHPRDAASVSVSATVPEGLEAVSNGVLRGQQTDAGWTTWSWLSAEPMATYLVTLGIGQFDLQTRDVGGIHYVDALDPDLSTLDLDPQTDGPSPGEVAQGSLAREPEMIDFLSGIFGPYPYSAAGAIVDDPVDLGFALETQTRPVYAPAFFSDQVSGDLVVVHELAHQWTGDLLRVDQWQYIWLNEGFATYIEWLWQEHEGLGAPQETFEQIAAGAPAEFWGIAIGDPGPAVGDLFAGAVYYRGAMTLQALRTTVGDDVFSRILREWVSTRAGGTVTTADFIALAERCSGTDLDAFFASWLGAGRPAVLGPQPEPLPAPEPVSAG